MKFEHFALNVPDARASAAWYIQHLGMTAARKMEAPPYTHFLADETGRIIFEVYTNTAAALPDHASAHPLSFHVAFVAAAAQAERKRLEAAGATFFKEETLADGTLLIMLRDPWGVALQLCQRTKPF
jgi:glyoxylase I family protein